MTEDYPEHQENRDAWNLTAAIYERDLEREIALLRAGENTLLEPERQILGDLRPWCRRAIHLQCAGGSDTLSLWNLGAAEVVGLDISPRMIAVARRKSEALDAPAAWVCGDVLAAPRDLDATADLVYTGRGALPWIADIAAWAQVVARLLRPGGRLLVFEGHPLDWVWDAKAATFQFDPRGGGYFARTVEYEHRWPAEFLDALDPQELPRGERPRLHERQWTLGDIMNALVAAGLRLLRFEEYPLQFWEHFQNIPPEAAQRLPHSFALLMQREPRD